MVTAAEIILEYVCPSLGLVTANLMFLAPVKDLQSAVTAGSGLGDLNPTPWAFMLGNCLGWVTYGVLTSDWFVFWGNYPGFLIACWLNLGAVKLMYSSHHKDEARKSLVEYLSSSTAAIVMEAQSQSLYFVENNSNEDDNDDDDDDDDDDDNDNSKDPKKTLDVTNNTSASSTASLAQHQANPIPNDTPSRPQKKQHDWVKIVLDVTSQTTPAKAPHDTLVIGMVILWSLVLSGIGFAKHYASLNGDSSEDFDLIAQYIVGYVVNLNLVFFYGAPLSAINRVLKTKRSDTLHVPTMVMNTCNAILWTSYAIAINDPYIYVPNGLGVILGTIQFLLWMIFPKTNKTFIDNGGDDSKYRDNDTTYGDGKNNNDGDLFSLRSSGTIPRNHAPKTARVRMDGSHVLG